MRQRWNLMSPISVSAMLLTYAGLIMHSFPVAAAPPTATPPTMAVVTDQAKLPVSNNFAMPPSAVRLADDGACCLRLRAVQACSAGWGQLPSDSSR